MSLGLSLNHEICCCCCIVWFVFFPFGNENLQCDSVFPSNEGIIKVTLEIPFIGRVLKQ